MSSSEALASGEGCSSAKHRHAAACRRNVSRLLILITRGIPPLGTVGYNAQLNQRFRMSPPIRASVSRDQRLAPICTRRVNQQTSPSLITRRVNQQQKPSSFRLLRNQPELQRGGSCIMRSSLLNYVCLSVTQRKGGRAVPEAKRPPL